MTYNVSLKLLVLIYSLCKVKIPILHLHPELQTCLHKYPLPTIDSRMETDPTVRITIPTILGQPYMHIPWSKKVYNECQSIGSDTVETIILQHYPPQQEDLVLDSSRHTSNQLFCMYRVSCKRVCIKFLGIGLCRYRTVPRKPHEV